MRSWFAKHWKRHMLRPTIYKASSRFAYLLVVALLWYRLVGQNRIPHGLSAMFAFIALGFLLAGWMAWLRMDGLHIPRLPARRRKKKKADMLFGDMIDYVDEPITEYADLADDEQNVVLFLADILCAVINGVLSLIV